MTTHESPDRTPGVSSSTPRPAAASGGAAAPGDADAAGGSLLYRLLRRIIDVRPEEARLLGWTWMFYFAVLSAYYVIRPIRDEMGVAGGVNNLPWLWTGTLIGMTLANPLFALLVCRLPRVKFIAVTYRFFMFNLLLFLGLFLTTTGGEAHIWAGRVFYVWTAVFNLFVISIFWAFMTDVFNSDQGRRLFGFISAGGTLGGAAGGLITSSLVGSIGPAALLLVSMALLEVAVFSVRRLSSLSAVLSQRYDPAVAERPIGGSAMAGIVGVVRSPYLLSISLYMLLFTVLSTFLYFQQANIVAAAYSDRAARTVFFANVDVAINVLAFFVQLFLTGRVLKLLGVAVTLTVLPIMSLIGFFTLGVAPTLWAVVIFQVLRRAGHFAVDRPTREVLYTVVNREDRYKAKSFIDTFVYRAGDQIGAWFYALLAFLGLGVSGIGFVAVPIALAWIVNGLWLGRRQEAMANNTAPADAELAAVDAAR